MTGVTLLVWAMEKALVAAGQDRLVPVAFRPRAGSPLIDAGIDLDLRPNLNLDGPPAKSQDVGDHLGTTVHQGRGPDVGAIEYAPGKE